MSGERGITTDDLEAMEGRSGEMMMIEINLDLGVHHPLEVATLIDSLAEQLRNLHRHSGGAWTDIRKAGAISGEPEREDSQARVGGEVHHKGGVLLKFVVAEMTIMSTVPTERKMVLQGTEDGTFVSVEEDDDDARPH